MASGLNLGTIPAYFPGGGWCGIKTCYQDDADFAAVHARLKWTPCPHCRHEGCLILHGFLYGYAEDQHTAKSKRGRRCFCSNRKKQKGCGKTFSLLIASFINHFRIAAKTLWLFLSNIASGLNRLQAFKQARVPLTVSSIYRLYKRFLKVQPRIRTLLQRVKDPPPGHGIPDPAVQTIRHLEALFQGDASPIAAFQLRFQVSFL